MSPITRATSPSTCLPACSPCSQQGLGAGNTPSNPRIRKAPQRVGKSASAILFTLSNAMVSILRLVHFHAVFSGTAKIP